MEAWMVTLLLHVLKAVLHALCDFAEALEAPEKK